MAANRRTDRPAPPRGYCLACAAPVFDGGLMFQGQEERIFLHLDCSRRLIGELSRDADLLAARRPGEIGAAGGEPLG